MNKFKTLVIGVNFMLSSAMICAQEPCDPDYQSPAQKTRIHQNLQKSKADTNTISKKIKPEQVPSNAFDLGDFNKQSASTSTLISQDLVKECERLQKPFITYQRGDEHFMLATKDLAHINQTHEDILQNLPAPHQTTTLISTDDEMVLQSDETYGRDSIDVDLGVSFHTMENFSAENLDVLIGHEGGHTLQNFKRALEIGPKAMQDELNAAAAVLLDHDPNNDGNQKVLAQEREFNPDKFTIGVFGSERFLQAMYAYAGYQNKLVAEAKNMTPQEAEAARNHVNNISFGFGDGDDPMHTSLGRRIQLGEAVQSCGLDVVAPQSDPGWKAPAVKTGVGVK